MANIRSEEATSEFKPEALEEFKAFKKKNGRYPLMAFYQDGNKVDYKITKIAAGRIWIKKTILVDPEHLKVVDSNE